MLLLDTHVWVWGTQDQSRLGGRTRRVLMRAESQGLVRLSPVTLFEVTALYTAGKLQLSRPVEQWIRDALDLSGFRLIDLTAVTAIDAGFILRTALPDPVDRLLVAAARQADATLVTADRAILTYARGGHVRVHDAAR